MNTNRHIAWATSLWFVATVATASAASLYVSTNGNDTTGLDWDNAYTDVQTALNATSEGDTIYVAGHTFAISRYDGVSGVYWTKSNITMIGGHAATNATETPGPCDPDQWPTVLTADNNPRIIVFDGVNGATLQNVRVTGSRLHSGGGLRIVDSTGISIIDCTIDDNKGTSSSNSELNGGGIWINDGSEVTLSGCLVEKNEANNGRAGYTAKGGGIWCEGSLQIVNSIIRNNRAINAAPASASTDGGGIYFDGPTLEMNNVLIFGNYAYAEGDGLHVSGGTVSLHNCTVADNPGEGIYQAGGTITGINSIVWGNIDDIENAAGDLTMSYSNVGDENFGGNNLSTDPLFEYGYYLADGSPCANAGSDTAVNLGMDGYAKNTAGDTYGGSETVNMGYHYEDAFDLTYADIYVAKDGDDGNSGTSALQPFQTVSKAFTMAQAGSRIHMATGSYANATETFPLALPGEPGIRVLGADASTTVLDASGSGERILTCIYSHRGVLQDLTLTGGSRTADYMGGAGAVIDQSQGFTLSGCRIFTNTFSVSHSGATYHGGGVHANRSELTVTDCRFQGNYIENRHGAGSSQGGGIWNDSKLTIRNSLFINNTAADTGGKGGAVAFNNGKLLMQNVLLKNNQSYDRGDGIYVEGGEAEIVNCTIADNDGEGTRRDGGDVSVLNSILWNNGIDSTGTVSIAYSVISNSTDYVDGGHNLGSDPLFVDASAGDYHLQEESPALGAGLVQAWMAEATDLEGNPRVSNGQVDLGVYQTVAPGGMLIMLK